MQPLEPLWIVHSLHDVTVENSINLKLKLLLMGSFFIVVKLNCLLQDERGGLTKAPADLNMLCGAMRGDAVRCIEKLGYM